MIRAMSSHRAVSAHDLIELVFDTGSYKSWDAPPPPRGGRDEVYEADLAKAARRSHVDEAVITGEATLHGRRVAVVLGEFAFLAGSIGLDAAERLLCGIERATRERLPLVASPTSGGTRMQEGTFAFVRMAAIAAAVARHRAAGLPYLVYLRHPTTGGVFASWASLGQLTAAQPGALVGFLGPRVYEALYGKPFPEGVQTSENLAERGIVDAVLEPEELPYVLARVLAVMCGPTTEPEPLPAAEPGLSDPPDIPAWFSVERSRRPERPGVVELLEQAADVTQVCGTGAGERDPGVQIALARFGTARCVVIGQDRHAQAEYGPLGPAALRAARRGMRLAAELGLPLVSVIDTPGAALSPEAEEGAVAGEIARCLADLMGLATPTVSVLLGPGTGGGALALLPADRVLCAQHSWLSPLPPEGASVIRFRTADHAAEMATAQGVRSRDLLATGVVDRIVPERPDASDEPDAFPGRLAAVLQEELITLTFSDSAELVRARFDRYRRLGAV